MHRHMLHTTHITKHVANMHVANMYDAYLVTDCKLPMVLLTGYIGQSPQPH